MFNTSLNNGSSKAFVPDYTAGVSFTSGDVTQYNGVLWFQTVWLYSTPATVTIDGDSHNIANGTSNGSCSCSATFIVGKGSKISYTGSSRATFYPLKGEINA